MCRSLGEAYRFSSQQCCSLSVARRISACLCRHACPSSRLLSGLIAQKQKRGGAVSPWGKLRRPAPSAAGRRQNILSQRQNILGLLQNVRSPRVQTANWLLYSCA